MANKVIGSIPYSLGLRPVNPGDYESEKKIGATLQERECITLSMLAKHMADHGTPFTHGVIQGVLTDMVSCVIELLKGGYSVSLDGLTKFYLGAKTELVPTVQDFNPATNIKKIIIRSRVASEASSEVNTNVDYEYVMTREEQAAAKKAAKLTLPQAETSDDDDDNQGGGSGSGGGGSVTE